MSMAVSVALCTHNGARFIEPQLQSILEQTVLPRQIVISDDASTDDTVSVATAILDRHTAVNGRTPIRTIILQNEIALGVARNFEHAILATTGDIVVLSDQDDVWHTDRLARALDKFDTRADLDLLFSNARLVDRAGASLDKSLFDVLEIGHSDLRNVRDGNALLSFIQRNLATGATMAFRRRLLDVTLPFPDAWIHDEWLAIMAAATGRLDVIDDALIDYRQHGSNVIGVDYPTLRRKVQRALEPRGERNERLSGQFEEFAVRLAALGELVSPGMLSLARAKARFETERERLPASRLRRLGPILAANRRGGYATFASQGRLDMVRDLLQPH